MIQLFSIRMIRPVGFGYNEKQQGGNINSDGSIKDNNFLIN